MVCKHCGSNLPDNTTRCPECGTVTTVPNVERTDAASLKKQPPKTIKILQPEPDKPPDSAKKRVVAALLFISAVAIVYFISYRNSGHNIQLKEEQTPATRINAVINEEAAVEGSLPETTAEPDALPNSRVYALNKEGIEHSRNRAYRRARESFESALREAPDNIAVRENLAAVLSHLAWQEILRSNYEEAIHLFQNALAHKPFLSTAQKGIGTAFLRLNEPDKAAPHIDAYIEKNPRDPHNKELLSVLADIFLKKGKRGEAEIYLERLLNIDPGNGEAARRLAILNKEAAVEQNFREKEGTHFTVKFQGGESSAIGHLISIILEEAYIKVGADIGYYPEDRIEAVLYTQQQFTDVTRAPGWAGALYDGRIKIPVGGITRATELLERVLFHEYTHALVHRLSNGRAPVWLNEGLAQYVEGSPNENINQVLAIIAKSDKPLLLRSLEVSFMGLNSSQALVAYSASLSATEYIINEFGTSAVRRILKAIGEGKTIDQAISSSLYISYEDLQKNWFGALKRRHAG